MCTPNSNGVPIVSRLKQHFIEKSSRFWDRSQSNASKNYSEIAGKYTATCSQLLQVPMVPMFVPTDNDNGHPMSTVCEVTSKSTQVSRWYRDALSFSETGLPNGPDESDCIISVLWTVYCINQKTSITSIAELIDPMSQAMRGWLQTQAIAEHYNAPWTQRAQRICGFVDRIGESMGESRKNHGDVFHRLLVTRCHQSPWTEIKKKCAFWKVLNRNSSRFPVVYLRIESEQHPSGECMSRKGATFSSRY